MILHARFGLFLLLASFCVFASTPKVNASRLHRAQQVDTSAYPFPWYDPSLPLDKRISMLIGNLTLEQKLSQVTNGADSVPSLGLPGYDYWSEASHGVAWAGRATLFPSPVAMAATFDSSLMWEVGTIIATEARGKWNDYRAKNNNNSGTFYGIDFYAPNINLFIHSLWGRGQETFGEDPTLTSLMASQYIVGIQGNYTLKAKYLSASGTAKHFAVFNIANNVNSYDAIVSQTDLLQTYLPAFKAAVLTGQVESIMCSYNAFNGIPSCAHPFLQSVIRDEWKFKGLIVSDAGAIQNMCDGHHYCNSTMQAAAQALNAGVDECLGGEYHSLDQAIKANLTTEAQVDIALSRILRRRFREGQFDPVDMVPFNNLSLADVDTSGHRQWARKVAQEAIVLLKNDGSFLPLNISSIKRIAIVGPNANRTFAMMGNYEACVNGPFSDVDPSCTIITPLVGITNAIASQGVKITFDAGLPHLVSNDTTGFASATSNAALADVVVAVMGLGTCEVQNNEPGPDCLEAEGLDRNDLQLPGLQTQLVQALAATGTPVVLVLVNAGPLAVKFAVVSPLIPSILEAWYGGEEGGTAIADILFGSVAPAGRLPVQVPLDESQLPNEYNTSMQTLPGLTYRYSTLVPLYSFGYGLSYSAFEYSYLSGTTSLLSNTTVRVQDAGKVTIRAIVSNIGNYISDEVIQVYVSYSNFPSSPITVNQSIPIKIFMSMARITFGPVNLSREVEFLFDPIPAYLVGSNGEYGLLPGIYFVYFGGSSPGSRGEYVDGENHHSTSVDLIISDVCENEVRQWLNERGINHKGKAVGDSVGISIEMSIFNGLVSILTVCP